MKVMRFAPVVCRCGSRLDASTPAFRPTAVPKQNDMSICMNCGAWMTFDSGNFRLMTDEEFLDLSMEEKETLNLVERKRREVVARRKEKPDG